jgi:predicted PurR-regulated permease PerM
VILATYMKPLRAWLQRANLPRGAAAVITMASVLLPLLAVIVYSYLELRDAVSYVATHRDMIAAQIDTEVRRMPYLAGATFTEQIQSAVLAASNYGAGFIEELRETSVELAVASAVFLFTMFYVLTRSDEIGIYLRAKIAPRYRELSNTLETNVRGVLYGTIYATLLTQTIKSVVILALNLIFDVPLAVVLAILSFVIGFFPIVGSWSVYVPVAAWLLIFAQSPTEALIVLAVGLLGNTMFVSMYVRPKIAAEKSRVLDFFWMFIGLVTGVYTFGIVGVLLGPVIIGLLKATLDTVTSHASWHLVGADGEPGTVVNQA